MDNKAWIVERLKNPALLGAGDENRLRELIAAYPAFSSAYLLLARRLHEMKHSAYESLLPALSLRAYDRKKLFYLIHAYPNLQTASQTPSPELEPELRSILPGSRFAIDFTSVEKEPETETEKAPEAELSEIPFGQIRQAHVSRVSDDEVEEAMQEARETDIPMAETESALPTDSHPEAESQPLVQSNQAEERAIEVEEEVPVGAETAAQEPAADFMAWLDKLSMTATEHVSAPSGENMHTIVEVDEIPAKVQETEPEIQEPEAVPVVNQLIDKFIETQPSVRRVKNEFFSPVNAAKQSEQEPDDLVTETIARILVKQEKFDKAIQAYEKLQLKYPAKNDYFAGLILELKQKTT